VEDHYNKDELVVDGSNQNLIGDLDFSKYIKLEKIVLDDNPLITNIILKDNQALKYFSYNNFSNYGPGNSFK
jgi:hypothetical protein